MKPLFFAFFIVFSVFAQQRSNSHVYSQVSPERDHNPGSDMILTHDPDSLISTVVDLINPDSIRHTIQQLQDMGTRNMTAPNRKQVAEWIRDRYIALGFENTVIDSFFATVYVNYPNIQVDTALWQYNVVASFTGSANHDDIYVMGSHYDCMNQDNFMGISPGADDNASGVAAAIEIARAMKASGYIPAATIHFIAFGAEEFMYYSDSTGASHYVNLALKGNKKIHFALINDMIANEPDETGWEFDLYTIDTASLLTRLAVEMSGKFTMLEPSMVFMDHLPDDASSFEANGFESLFFIEHNFSNNYHTANDVVDSCNMEYCAELTRLNAAMLVRSASSPLAVKSFFIGDPGNGTSLNPHWKASTESDLEGYNLYFGSQPGIYDTVITTTDTSFLFDGLSQGDLYYIAVSAINTDGYESALIEKNGSPSIITLDKGILIVNDSKGGISNPTDDDINTMYDTLCYGFEHELLDATNLDKMPISILGQYSSVIWHIENFQWDASVLNASRDDIRNYLDAGGHCLFTLYNPTEMIGEAKEYPAAFKEGTFMYDIANIDSVRNEPMKWFSGAKPVLSMFDSIYIDPVKIPSNNHQVPFIEALTPAPGGEVIYLYDSEYDSLTPQGSYKGLPVAIQNKEPEKNVVITSFPLFYMEPSQAEAFVFTVMHDLFGEGYLGITHEPGMDDDLNLEIFPNPATDILNIAFTLKETQSVNIRLFNIYGQEMISLLNGRYEKGCHIVPVQIENLEQGLYLCEIGTNNEIRQAIQVMIH